MTEGMNLATAQAVVTGTVQGVGFRQFVKRKARNLNLAGWVRNRQDSQAVEFVVQGERDAVEKLLQIAGTGPPGSSVNQIDIEWITTLDLPDPFEIRQ